MRGQAGLGLGDAKLFAAAGAWAGLEGLASVLLYGSLAALVWAGFWAIRGHEVSRTTRLAFGPFLAIGLWWVWLYGPATFAI
jgi:leader peptidase (prepilin peptidase) / N-methyltransferase